MCISCVRANAFVVCVRVGVCVCVCDSCSVVSICAGITVPVQLSSRNTVVGRGALCGGGRERNYLRSQDNVFG